VKVKIKFFAYFRDLFQAKEKEILLRDEATVRDVLDLLCDTPQRTDEVFAKRELKPHLVVMKNGVHINSLDGLSTRVAAGDVIAVFPFIAGG